jgi:hypothetical protein
VSTVEYLSQGVAVDLDSYRVLCAAPLIIRSY